MAEPEDIQMVKRMIVDSHKRGVCDRNGKTLESFQKKVKGTEHIHHWVSNNNYRRNYERIFGHS